MFLFYFLLLTAEFSHCLSLKEIVNSLPPLPFLSCFFVSFFLHGNEMKHFKILKWSSRCFAKLGSKWSLKARWNWEGTFSKWRKKTMCACKWKFRVRNQALEKDPFFLLCILCMGIFCKKSQILCLVCVWQWGNKWAGLDLWHCWKVERRWSCSAPCTSLGRKRWGGGSASSIRQIKAISFWGAKSSFNESHPADSAVGILLVALLATCHLWLAGPGAGPMKLGVTRWMQLHPCPWRGRIVMLPVVQITHFVCSLELNTSYVWANNCNSNPEWLGLRCVFNKIIEMPWE